VYEQVREVPCHKWLFGLAIVLSVVSLPYAVVVYVQHLPGSILLVLSTAAVVLWVLGELRRQEWKRLRRQGDLQELVAAVERR